MSSSSFRIFDIVGSSLSAQSLRLNTVASNLANADTVSGNPDSVYKERLPVFQATQVGSTPDSVGVRVLGVVEGNTPAVQRYEPGNPIADAQGYVYAPDINPVQQMVNMISASRDYQSSIDIMNTTKSLHQQVLNLGK
jgi:flagellar basal-body rod protein FlgC